MRMKNYMIWQALVLPLLFCSCSGDDDGDAKGGNDPTNAIAISAGIRVPTGDSTLGETNEWASIYDRRVAVEVEGTVRQYLADENGRLTSADPFYWDGRETLSLNVWYPYNDGVKPEAVVVKANQGIDAYYWASNLMGADGVTLSAENSTVELTHRTAKVVCTLSIKDGAARNTAYLAGAKATLCNLQGVDEGNSIRMTSDHKAFVAPQTVPMGTEFVQVTLPDGNAGVLKLDADLVLEAGRAYTVALSLTPPAQISGVITESGGWGQASGGAEDTLNGQTDGTTEEKPEVKPEDKPGDKPTQPSEPKPTLPEVMPDANTGGSWGGNGDEDTLNGTGGSTPGVKPDTEGNSGSWNPSGDEDTLTGNGGGSTQPDTNKPVTPGTGGGSWNEHTEGDDTLDGKLPPVNPQTGGSDNTGNGTWSTDKEVDLEGNKETTNSQNNN